MTGKTIRVAVAVLCIAIACTNRSAAATVTVAICQIEPKRFDVPANVAKIEDYVKQAAAQGAQICVLPELADVSFLGGDTGAFENAKPVPGTTSDALGRIAAAHNMWIATAVLERTEDGVYDTNILVNSNGKVVLKQRKLWTYATFGGMRCFQGNYQDARVVMTPWGPVGMMNCMDVSIPAARRLFGKLQPVLMLVSYANPGADWLINKLSEVARDAGCPAIGVNHVFPPSAGKSGGRSRIVSAEGQQLWAAPRGTELLKTWVFQVPDGRRMPPRVDAGRVTTIRLPDNVVQLRGHAVANDSGLETMWAKASGPGEVSFEDPHALTTPATFSLAGVYRLRLSAGDETTAASDIVSVTVLPQGNGDLNLAGHWTFDRTSDDCSGNGNHARFHGDPTYGHDVAPTGTRNIGSLDLDGEGDYVEVRHAESLNAPHAATVSLWFKPRSQPRGGGGCVLLGKGTGYLDLKFNYMLLQTASYYVEAQGMDGMRAVTIGDTIQAMNTWHHVAAVYDGDKGHTRLYFNGVLDATVCGAPGRRRVNTRPVLMGARETKADGLNGLIDDVRVYTRALSDEEIAAFVRGAKINEPPMVDAGPDLKVEVGRTVVVRGSFEDDGRGTAAISQWHRWVKVAGPSDVIIDNPYSLKTNVMFPLPGAYVLELQGSDGGQTEYDTFNVTVN